MIVENEDAGAEGRRQAKIKEIRVTSILEDERRFDVTAGRNDRGASDRARFERERGDQRKGGREN